MTSVFNIGGDISPIPIGPNPDIEQGENVDEYAKAVTKIDSMSDQNLLTAWEALADYDPAENYAPGVSMDEWASMVYSEISQRGLLRRESPSPHAEACNHGGAMMLSSFEITKKRQRIADRNGLMVELIWMNEDEVIIVRTELTPDLPDIEVQRVDDGWIIEGSVVQKTPKAALEAILGFLGEYPQSYIDEANSGE